MGRCVPWVEPQHFLILRDGAPGLAHAHEQQSQVEMRRFLVRIDRESGPVVLQGGFQFAPISQKVGHGGVGRSAIRRITQRLL